MIAIDHIEDGFGGSYEDLSGVEVVGPTSRPDGTSVGMRSVDGFYYVKGRGEVRQMRHYDVKTDEEAIRLAREGGLARGIIVETILTERGEVSDNPCRNIPIDPRNTSKNHFGGSQQ